MLTEFNIPNKIESTWSAILAGVFCIVDIAGIYLLLLLINPPQ